MIRHPTARRSRRLAAGLPHLPALSRAERLAAALDGRLDDAFHWFRAIAPGGIERLDAAVVGPGGTWVIAFAGEHGRFRHRNGHWYRWNRSTESWVPWDAIGVTRARMAGRRLSLYLERAGLPAGVDVAMMVGRSTDLAWDPGEVPSLFLAPDPDRLAQRMLRDEVLTRSQVDRIVALLDPRQPLPQLAPSTPRG